MGLYPIACIQCGKPFLWFSGTLDQRCYDCIEVWTRKAVALTIIDRLINKFGKDILEKKKND